MFNDTAQHVKHSLVPPLLYSSIKLYFLSFCNAQGSVLDTEKAGMIPVLWKPRV